MLESTYYLSFPRDRLSDQAKQERRAIIAWLKKHKFPLDPNAEGARVLGTSLRVGRVAVLITGRNNFAVVTTPADS